MPLDIFYLFHEKWCSIKVLLIQSLAFSTFCYVTALLQTVLNSFLSSKFYRQISCYDKKRIWYICFFANLLQIDNKIHSLISWIWCHKRCTPIFKQFLPILFWHTSRVPPGCMKDNQVETSLHRCLIWFRPVFWLGPSRTVTKWF